MTMHKVLIPLDGSEFSRQVIPYVRRFMSPSDYEVTLFRSADEPTGVLATPFPEIALSGMLLPAYRSEPATVQDQHPIFASQVRETMVSALTDELRAEARELQDAGYKMCFDVRCGDPAEEIVACVEERNIDLVVMATHGRTGVKRLVLGSVAEQVLRHLQVPVMLIRPV